MKVLHNNSKINVANISSVLTKATNIEKWLRNVPPSSKASCTLLMLWNTYFSQWIIVPCDEPLLDFASLYCVKLTQQIFLKQMKTDKNETKRTPHSRMPISNVFACLDNKLIFVTLVCNRRKDCSQNEDELFCKELFHDIPLEDLLGCSFNLKFFRKEKIQYFKNNFTVAHGCDFIATKHEPLDFSKFSCTNAVIKCIYQLKSPTNRQLYPCQNGTHLDFCGEVKCHDTFKCPGYYCIPWRYVCDGHWDCPAGKDEIECGYESKPGFLHCPSSVITILPKSMELKKLCVFSMIPSAQMSVFVFFQT